MCSHGHVILHLSSKCRRNDVIGCEVMTSYQFFSRWRPYKRKSTPGFSFSNGVCL